jgi:sortase A
MSRRPRAVPPVSGGIVGYLAAHRAARRGLGIVAVLLVLGAAAAAGYPFLTDRYTETVQHRLGRQLNSQATRIAYRQRRIPVGDSLTRIRIPKIGVDTIVVEGTTQSALRAGAGHYRQTPLPCNGGNVAIAGHRVTYGKPFTDLEKLAVGDEVFLDTPVGGCTYRITAAPFPVDPSDVSVVAPTTDPELTLTTCHPEHSARQRLVVRAVRIATHSGTI